MKSQKEKIVKYGEIYLHDFGKHTGSIQNEVHPAVVIQGDDINRNSSTTIVACITPATKKKYLPSHIFIGAKYGLTKSSMIMTEQLVTVNQENHKSYIGIIDDDRTLKSIWRALKKTTGHWDYNKYKNLNLCLCGKCLSDYYSTQLYFFSRADPFQKNKDVCTICSSGFGYDYIVSKKNNNN